MRLPRVTMDEMVKYLLAALTLLSLIPYGAALAQAVPPPATNSRLPKETQAARLALKAEGLQSTGKFSEAAVLLQQAAELTPDDASLWEKAGWAHLDAGSAAPALKAFEAARKAAPPGPRETAASVGGLLISQFALGNAKEVETLVRRVVPANGVPAVMAAVTKGLAAKQPAPDWNYALGYLYARVLQSSARGVGIIEEVVKVQPKNAEAWLLLVEMNQDLDRGAREDSAAIKYLELAPETVDAYRLRAQRFAALRKTREAVAEYEAGVVKYPTSSELHYQLARVHERSGGAKQAEAVYRKLIAAATARNDDKLRDEARTQLAIFQARQKNYVEAEKFYREAAARPDAAAPVWASWGALLALQARWEDAAKAFDGAASRDQKDGGASRDDVMVSRYRAAACRLADGRKDTARAGFESALPPAGAVRSTTEIEIAAFLAWIRGRTAPLDRLAYQRPDERWAGFSWRAEPDEGELEVRGRFSLPATAWRAILQGIQRKSPDCWPADYAVARIYAAGGFSEEALRLLGRVTRGRADWWAPFYAMGQHYARERDREKGIEVLSRAVQLAPGCGPARTYLSLLRNLKEDDGDL